MSRAPVFVLTVALLLSAAPPADAQVSFSGGWSQNPSFIDADVGMTQFIPRTFYFVALDLDRGIRSFDVTLEGTDALDLVVLDVRYPTAGAVNGGSGFDFLVDLGECTEPTGPTVLVQVTVAQLQSNPVYDLLLCPSSSTGGPATVTDCDGQTLPVEGVDTFACYGIYGLIENGCLLINRGYGCPLPAEATSFGAVKALY